MLKRFKRSTVIAAGIVGLLTAASFAFFAGSFLAEGEHTGTAGQGGSGIESLPLAVSFPSNELTPTHAVPLTATLNNITKHSVSFGKIHVTITTGSPQCLPAWFKVSATGGQDEEFFQQHLEGKGNEGMLPYGPGSHELGMPMGATGETKFALEMVETGVDQSACEAEPITVAMKVSE